MKSIIIAGPPRAGKTTLARKLNEALNCFVISVDKLAAVFDGAFPQLDIRLNWNREKTTDNIAPFLGHFLGAFSSAVEGNRFVLEGAYFNFDKILPILNLYGIEELKDRFFLIGLVQNNKTAEAFAGDLKKYDTEDDWTYGFDDDELREIGRDEIAFSRSMTGQLVKYGFTIYDTSARRERVFEQIAEDIESKL